MINYTWGVDGLGRQHIGEKNSVVIIFCMLQGYSAHCGIDLLINQK